MELEIKIKDASLPEQYLKEVKDLIELGGKRLNHRDDTEVSITFVSDDEIHQINKNYRNKDRVTDVISFAIEDGEDTKILSMLADQGIPRDLGDLFIAPNFVFKRARDLGHSVERELGYTVIHGLLHLSGYDHTTSEQEDEMINLQEEILKSYGLQK
ncbi:rRNA maturation RNase YbeY [Xylocopilactobacillus apicola]|uniref:Endoribonuclease YbeY n=1 Tax=Xylocopilactobacillus apicola TaxID=2932184 RepID=A0AAU9DAQ9_9LACO|nr:rRNA maturation RNase YbeY [Xylocopilactobacillus apicola]BDR58630.1 endoribonuclease YbeY [Xylocopilactobacillus apicola]